MRSAHAPDADNHRRVSPQPATHSNPRPERRHLRPERFGGARLHGSWEFVLLRPARGVGSLMGWQVRNSRVPTSTHWVAPPPLEIKHADREKPAPDHVPITSTSILLGCSLLAPSGSEPALAAIESTSAPIRWVRAQRPSILRFSQDSRLRISELRWWHVVPFHPHIRGPLNDLLSRRNPFEGPCSYSDRGDTPEGQHERGAQNYAVGHWIVGRY